MRFLFALSVVAALACSLTVEAQDTRISFFVTSSGPGNGADLGGLAGADAHCQALAAAAARGQSDLACIFEHRGRRGPR